MGKTSTAAKNKWNAKNYERISLSVNKGTKELLQKAAAQEAESLNGFIKKAIEERYLNITAKKIEL